MDPAAQPAAGAPRRGGVALITGASRGIGRAIAIALAAEGLQVAAVARQAGRLEATVAACAAAGTPARAFPTDLLAAGAPEQLVQRVLGWRGRLDVVVNNAGLYARGPLAEMAPAEVERLIATNVTSVALLARAATAALLAAPAGLLVNLASVAALAGIPGEALYAASKHAVLGLSRALAAELGPQGVGCAALCPGLVATDMAAGRGADLGRALSPEDVAAAVCFIVRQPARALVSELVLQPSRPPF